jgi:phosphonoacetaldehyde hydrolase
MELDVFPMNRIIKVGDTVTDMQEGKNAGMWTVGVILGSSEMGLSEEAEKNMDQKELKIKMKEVRSRLEEAGANFVVDRISDLDQVINQLEQQ